MHSREMPLLLPAGLSVAVLKDDHRESGRDGVVRLH